MLEWLVLFIIYVCHFYLNPNHFPNHRILKGESVLVLGHRRPDGDCIGSQDVTRILIQKGINARAVNSDPVPNLEKFVGDTPW